MKPMTPARRDAACACRPRNDILLCSYVVGVHAGDYLNRCYQKETKRSELGLRRS